MKLTHLISVACCLYIVSAVEFCKKDIYEGEFYTLIKNSTFVKLDALAIWYPARTGSYQIGKLCSNITGRPIQRQCRPVENTATWDAAIKSMQLLDCGVIPNKCVEETFEHFYVMKNKVPLPHTNKWLAAKIGEYAKTEDICLLKTGLPLTRKCVYNSKNHEAAWEDKVFKDIQCLKDIKEEIVTSDLNKLYKKVEAENKTSNDKNNLAVATELTTILNKENAVRIASDLEITTNILELITSTDREPVLTPSILQITNLLMQSDVKAVQNSYKLDTPLRLLNTIENYYDDMTNVLTPPHNCPADSNGVRNIIQNLTSVYFINPLCSNISGIAVYDTTVQSTPSMLYDVNTDTYFRYIYLNESVDEIANEADLEVAGYFPQTLWDTLQNEAREDKDTSNMNAVRFSLYQNKNFFLDRANKQKFPASVVMKISMPHYKGDLPGYVPMIFQNHQADMNEKTQCGAYNMGTWKGSEASKIYGRNIVLCKTTRLTSFSSLLGLNYKSNSKLSDFEVLTAAMGFSQDIISIVGCTLSLFGLLCIWLTAICCKQWRQKSSTLLLLNICLVLTLLMTYFLFINIPDMRSLIIDMNDVNYCIIEGAFLQYCVSVLFLWMLIVAILQYHRYVTVLGIDKYTSGLKKYIIPAWGLPIIPTGLVIYLDPKSYEPISEGGMASGDICYPSGRSFYIAVFVPISIIIVVNVFIFMYIMCSLRHAMKKFERARDRKDFIAQIRLSILHFFLLGVTWLFGVLAHMDDSGVLAFLFCSTSTFQGFVLFLYFVIIDKSVRKSWLICCSGGKDYYTMEDSSSMTQMRKFSR